MKRSESSALYVSNATNSGARKVRGKRKTDPDADTENCARCSNVRSDCCTVNVLSSSQLRVQVTIFTQLALDKNVEGYGCILACACVFKAVTDFCIV